MKFLVSDYNCLQNPWLGATAPRSLFSLSSVLNWICWTPPPKKKKIPGYATASTCLYVCPSAWNNLAPTGRIFMTFDIWVFFPLFPHSSSNDKCFIRKLTISEKCDVYEMWKIMVGTERPRMTTRRMRFECWIPNATDKHSEYVIPIAFPLQKC